MVVADIAYERLTPNAKAKVDKMVLNFSKEYPEFASFNMMAIWPDAIRGQQVEIFTHWHYIDHAFSDDGTSIHNEIDSDNAVWAMNQIEPIIKHHGGNAYEQARFLAFLIHIAGDLHQPLHNVTRVSATHPDGDKGGNLFLVQSTSDPTQLIPLHRLWDEGLGMFRVEPTPDTVKGLSQLVTGTYPESYFEHALEVLTPDKWSGEGIEVAKQNVYATTENNIPNPQYLLDGREVTKQRVALAGYRLAAILNSWLD